MLFDQKQNNCILDALEKIIERQPDSCDICCPTIKGEVYTVPLIIYNKNDDPLVRFGNVGGFTGDMICFKTIFFRVEALNDSCATLSLLRPVDMDGNTESVVDPCDEDFFGLEKTNFCIEVDLDCFCGIQCLLPELVDRTF